MKNRIADLINSDRSSLSPEIIKQMLIDILEEGSKVVQSIIFNEGVKIYRAREIKEISDVVSIEDISYLKPEYNKSYKRASTPNLYILIENGATVIIEKGATKEIAKNDYFS